MDKYQVVGTNFWIQQEIPTSYVLVGSYFQETDK